MTSASAVRADYNTLFECMKLEALPIMKCIFDRMSIEHVVCGSLLQTLMNAPSKAITATSMPVVPIPMALSPASVIKALGAMASCAKVSRICDLFRKT